MKQLTEEEKKKRFERLPEWARAHIETLTRQRDAAVDTLNQFQDSQTKSRVSFTEMVCTGERQSYKTRYIPTDLVEFNAHDLYMTVRIGYERDKFIHVTYGGGSKFLGAECALIPESFQQFRIVAKHNLRD